MKLYIAKDYDEMSAMAADYVTAFIQNKKDARVGLTTGNSPKGFYSVLAQKQQEGAIDLSQIKVFSLEEYLGVSPEDHRSLYSWLKRMVIDPCQLSDDQVYRIIGEDPEPQQACERYDQQIGEAGGLDLIVEGIGTNGHIGFNEPGSRLDCTTRIVGLTEETHTYNYAYWNGDVPRYGMTVGIQQMVNCGHVVLLASGVRKAEALKRTLCDAMTAEVPASYLQKLPELIVFADEEAASLIKL